MLELSAEKIFLPKTRQAKLLKLLGLEGQATVTEILLTPDGGLVTRYVLDDHGNRVSVPGHPKQDQQEMVEIVFTDEPDPMSSSSRAVDDA